MKMNVLQNTAERTSVVDWRFLLSTYQKPTQAGSEELWKLQLQTVEMCTSEGRDNNNILEKVAIPKGSILHQQNPLSTRKKKLWKVHFGGKKQHK